MFLGRVVDDTHAYVSICMCGGQKSNLGVFHLVY